MSDRLYLRYKGDIIFEKESPGSIIVDKSLINYSFNVSDNEINVNLKLLQNGKTIEAESIVDNFNPKILQILRTNYYDNLTNGEKTELSNFTHPIRKAVIQFVGLLKQELHRYDINDELIGNAYLEWSIGDDKWFTMPWGLRADTWSTSLGNLNANTAIGMQELLSENEEALVATSYLHQARDSQNRRYQWIYATMAAELAVKEILIRIEPKLKVILETLPSPPLRKLYGEVLEDVAGVKSPNLRTLQKGSEIRNKLIHDPKSPTPTFKETNEYINSIEDTVKWLLQVCRKKKRVKKH